ncbi:RIP metalloprotease RseP [Mucilaginibacter auburnensis]|uniref:Zinc metalloprotease n=1 Tax=Mucilaginibacter auburnensis TaxID=1457233 RepID=A0A2H9VLS0_9SPHI|nr:RIP metalloprotease RseP [Mucilaginibacter auburnensis]PJJ79288.1 regulator of sigma E protease [Mucilaginibacter auburnensis]
MGIVIMVGQLILGLSILVILHELGHFLAARAFGIRVEKFYLFFDAWNFSLFKFTYKDVEYGIGWLPLGGYVKISGMIDESMDTEQMAGPPQPWEFRSKPAWQRLIVMMGGIIVNVILGIFIFWMLTARYGETYVPTANIEHGIVPGVIGKKMGLQAGDRIIAVNGQEVDRFSDLRSTKVLLDHTVLTIKRGDKTLEVTVPSNIINDLADYGQDGLEQFISSLPRSTFTVGEIQPNTGAASAGLLKGDSIVSINNKPVLFYDQLVSELKANKSKTVDVGVWRADSTKHLTAKVSPTGTLGFRADFNLPKQVTVDYGVVGSLPVGAERAWGTFIDNIKGLSKVFKGDVELGKAVGGPVAIATMFGTELNWIHFWTMVGFLSMVLAFTNLLPIPALDGGHAVFLIIEMVKGKPLSDKFLERAQVVGFVLLITLMVFVFGNDIMKHVINK